MFIPQPAYPIKQLLQIIRVEMAGSGQFPHKIFRSGRIAEQLLPAAGAFHGIRLQIQIEDHALTLTGQKLMAACLGLQPVDGFVELGVVADGMVYILLSILLHKDAAAVQHPEGLCFFPQEPVLRIRTSASQQQLLRSLQKRLPIRGVHQFQQLPAKLFRNLHRAVASKAHEISRTGMDALFSVAPAAQSGTHQPLQGHGVVQSCGREVRLPDR